MRYIKDPSAVLDYRVDWSQWLPANDRIVASSFAVVDSDDLVIDDSSFDDTSATVWLSGGVAGQRYVVTNHITTEDGREDDRSLTITAKEL